MSETKHSFILGEREEAFIEAQVKAGGFPDASAVVRTALLLLEDQKAELDRLEADQDDLREKIMVGIKDIEEGRYTEITSIDDFVEQIVGKGTRQSKRAS